MNATTSGDRYTIVSADCHAGGDIDDYRPYLPSGLHADFDAWRQDYINPFADLQDSKRARNWDTAVRRRDLEADGQVAEVYNLDLDALASVGVGPTVVEVAEPLTELPDNPSMAFRFRP